MTKICKKVADDGECAIVGDHLSRFRIFRAHN